MVGLVYQFFICFMLLTFPFVPLFPSWMPSYALSIVNPFKFTFTFGCL